MAVVVSITRPIVQSVRRCHKRRVPGRGDSLLEFRTDQQARGRLPGGQDQVDGRGAVRVTRRVDPPNVIRPRRQAGEAVRAVRTRRCRLLAGVQLAVVVRIEEHRLAAGLHFGALVLAVLVIVVEGETADRGGMRVGGRGVAGAEAEEPAHRLPVGGAADVVIRRRRERAIALVTQRHAVRLSVGRQREAPQPTVVDVRRIQVAIVEVAVVVRVDVDGPAKGLAVLALGFVVFSIFVVVDDGPPADGKELRRRGARMAAEHDRRHTRCRFAHGERRVGGGGLCPTGRQHLSDGIRARHHRKGEGAVAVHVVTGIAGILLAAIVGVGEDERAAAGRGRTFAGVLLAVAVGVVEHLPVDDQRRRGQERQPEIRAGRNARRPGHVGGQFQLAVDGERRRRVQAAADPAGLVPAGGQLLAEGVRAGRQIERAAPAINRVAYGVILVAVTLAVVVGVDVHHPAGREVVAAELAVGIIERGHLVFAVAVGVVEYADAHAIKLLLPERPRRGRLSRAHHHRVIGRGRFAVAVNSDVVSPGLQVADRERAGAGVLEILLLVGVVLVVVVEVDERRRRLAAGVNGFSAVLFAIAVEIDKDRTGDHAGRAGGDGVAFQIMAGGDGGGAALDGGAQRRGIGPALGGGFADRERADRQPEGVRAVGGRLVDVVAAVFDAVMVVVGKDEAIAEPFAGVVLAVVIGVLIDVPGVRRRMEVAQPLRESLAAGDGYVQRVDAGQVVFAAGVLRPDQVQARLQRHRAVAREPGLAGVGDVVLVGVVPVGDVRRRSGLASVLNPVIVGVEKSVDRDRRVPPRARVRGGSHGALERHRRQRFGLRKSCREQKAQRVTLADRKAARGDRVSAAGVGDGLRLGRLVFAVGVQVDVRRHAGQAFVGCGDVHPVGIGVFKNMTGDRRSQQTAQL